MNSSPTETINITQEPVQSSVAEVPGPAPGDVTTEAHVHRISRMAHIPGGPLVNLEPALAEGAVAT
jgi:hypothetical protein